MESNSQDRNLPASERRLKRAAQDGQVTRSRDLSNLAVLGAGSLALLALAPFMFDQIKLRVSQQLTFDAVTIVSPQTMLTRLQEMAAIGLLGCTVFALIVMVAVIFEFGRGRRLDQQPQARVAGPEPA